MVANGGSTRIDTQELKYHIYMRIGPQKAEEYFEHLRRFLFSRLSKADFDKSCIRTLGRKNIRLHNLLIRAIIHNSNLAKLPPQRARKFVGGLGVRTASSQQRSCFQSLCGDGVLASPRKCRSLVNWERKMHDRPSPLGPLGKSLSLTYEETVSRIQEQSAAELHSISSKPPKGAAPVVEEGEEVEQFSGFQSERGHVTAPVGVSIISGLSRKTLPYQSFSETCQSSGELPDTASLRSRLEKKLGSEGLTVSLQGANAINKGLDVFLKRMLESCIPSGRSHHREHTHSLSMQQNDQISHETHSQNTHPPLSMLGFHLAMETNPSILGENWPSQLEKISHLSFQ